MNPTVIQALSLTGAFLVLAGYGGQQYAGLRGDSLGYGVLNLVGSALLAVSAIAPFDGGVLLLESAWSAISLGIVVRVVGRRAKTGGHSDPPKSAS